jgi:hypothetical protein
MRHERRKRNETIDFRKKDIRAIALKMSDP